MVTTARVWRRCIAPPFSPMLLVSAGIICYGNAPMGLSGSMNSRLIIQVATYRGHYLLGAVGERQPLLVAPIRLLRVDSEIEPRQPRHVSIESQKTIEPSA